jgi:hypothetical protein
VAVGGRQPDRQRDPADPGGPIELVTANATPEEAEAFRRWLLVAAQAAADAGKGVEFLTRS